ncbi:MAG TPA: autotransporter-associated beta strand repeat-containing protein, partial [Novosphingobium sp.]|nr:autotransporter-associated beta strand repeat-containing protein [Novosphingobium sp.]
MSNIFLKASHVCRARRKKLLASTALLAVATQPVAASASDVIIFNYSSYNGTQTNLANAQTTAGNTATIASPGTTVDLSGYAQVWDLGFSTALTQAQITYYTNYLQNGGTLFLMGENSGFQARDSSITSLINALGGGTATVSSNSNSSNSQTVASQFLLANQTSAVSFAAIGQFTSLGTGTCITSDCGAAAWGVGKLSGAPTGTIITVLDVNFLDNTFYQSAFVANLIAYLTQQQQVAQNPPPALGNITTTDGSALTSQVGTSLAARFDGGELTADQDSSSNFSVTSNGGILNANGGRYVFSGVFSDDSGTPSGLLIVDRVGGGAIVLTGINTFSGGIGVQAGARLSIANGASLGTGLLQLIGTSLTPAYFEITGTTTIANNITVAGDPVFDVAGGSTATISGSINDGATPGDVVKQGDGTLVLSGVNGYTGGTVLSAGTLALSGNGTLGATSGITTVNAGTLDLGGTTQTQDGGVSLTGGTITNGTLSSAGTFDMQAGSVDAVLTGAGSLVKSGEGTVTLSGANSYTGGTTISGG